MVVCRDENQQVCEQDFASICPDNWHLCTPLEHSARNDDGWVEVVELPGNLRALGTIRCRPNDGAGHFTVENVAEDRGPNCDYGSSLAWCPAWYGCNEQQHTALCCRPLPSCGNGVVDHPQEQCDDGNDNEEDDCQSSCYSGRC